MFDSTTAADIPVGARMVAGYIDGRYRWSAADWARFPDAVTVRIAVDSATLDGQVLDVETGDATPQQAVTWVLARRTMGADPSVYTGANEWVDVRAAFANANVPEPHWWIARWDGIAAFSQADAPMMAKQYANSALTGGHYDASVVEDFWPGVDNVDQFVTKAEFEAYKVALQAELDATYAAKFHPHTATASTTTITLLPPTITVS